MSPKHIENARIEAVFRFLGRIELDLEMNWGLYTVVPMTPQLSNPKWKTSSSFRISLRREALRTVLEPVDVVTVPRPD